MNPEPSSWRDRAELALWFHDVVYDARRKDNEERSALVLQGAGALMGIDLGQLSFVAEIIIKTHHTPGTRVGSKAEQWALDCDLASLGFAPDVFDKHSEAIRQEYAHVPDDLFRAGRKAALNDFLQRVNIYRTEECRARFDAQARANLTRAIAALG